MPEPPDDESDDQEQAQQDHDRCQQQRHGAVYAGSCKAALGLFGEPGNPGFRTVRIMMVVRPAAGPVRHYRPIRWRSRGGADRGEVKRVKDSAAMTDAQSMALK